MIFLLIFLFQFSSISPTDWRLQFLHRNQHTALDWSEPSLRVSACVVPPYPSQEADGENGDFLQRNLLENSKKNMFVDCWYISIEFSMFVIHAQHICIYLILFNKGSSWNWMGLLPNFLAIYGEFDPNGRDMVTWHFYRSIFGSGWGLFAASHQRKCCAAGASRTILVDFTKDDDHQSGVGNCPILGILDITKNSSHLVDHIPNGWVMFNGDI